MIPHAILLYASFYRLFPLRDFKIAILFFSILYDADEFESTLYSFHFTARHVFSVLLLLLPFSTFVSHYFRLSLFSFSTLKFRVQSKFCLRESRADDDLWQWFSNFFGFQMITLVGQQFKEDIEGIAVHLSSFASLNSQDYPSSSILI